MTPESQTTTSAASEVRYLGAPSSERGDLEQATADAIAKSAKQTDGDILVFLPGVGEIKGWEGCLSTVL